MGFFSELQMKNAKGYDNFLQKKEEKKMNELIELQEKREKAKNHLKTLQDKKKEEEQKRLKELQDKKDEEEAKHLKELQDKQEEEKKRIKELEEKEEDDLALALALSQSEADQKKHVRWAYTPTAPTAESHSFLGSANTGSKKEAVAPSTTDVRTLSPDDLSVDSQLARYLDRSFWEQKSNKIAAIPPKKTFHASSRDSQVNVFKPFATGPKKYVKPREDFTFSNNAKRNSFGFPGDYLEKSSQKLNVFQKNGDIEKTKRLCKAISERIDAMIIRMESNGKSMDRNEAALLAQLVVVLEEALERLNSYEKQREHYERLQKEHEAAVREKQEIQERIQAQQRAHQAQIREQLQPGRMEMPDMILNQDQMNGYGYYSAPPTSIYSQPLPQNVPQHGPVLYQQQPMTPAQPEHLLGQSLSSQMYPQTMDPYLAGQPRAHGYPTEQQMFKHPSQDAYHGPHH